VAWVKTRFIQWNAGIVSPILFIVTDRLVDFYPLRQFAPVIHGIHRPGAASQWAPTAGICSSGKEIKGKNRHSGGIC